MATNLLQDGNTLDWTNGTGKAVASGDLVVVGNVAGVAHADIGVDAPGVLHMTGVFILPKASEDIVQGQKVYVANGKITAAAAPSGDGAAGNPLAGTAWTTGVKADGTVAVRLGF